MLSSLTTDHTDHTDLSSGRKQHLPPDRTKQIARANDQNGRTEIPFVGPLHALGHLSPVKITADIPEDKGR